MAQPPVARVRHILVQLTIATLVMLSGPRRGHPLHPPVLIIMKSWERVSAVTTALMRQARVPRISTAPTIVWPATSSDPRRGRPLHRPVLIIMKSWAPVSAVTRAPLPVARARHTLPQLIIVRPVMRLAPRHGNRLRRLVSIIMR
jgi:hypothetical protein